MNKTKADEVKIQAVSPPLAIAIAAAAATAGLAKEVNVAAAVAATNASGFTSKDFFFELFGVSTPPMAKSFEKSPSFEVVNAAGEVRLEK